MKEQLQAALAQRQKKQIIDPTRLKSAVLVPIYWREGQYYILFTKRSEDVATHKGQISFPGGTYEEDDVTLLNTALRESEEEIGLATSDIEVLGELDDTVALVSNYIISPFVAAIPWPYHFKVDGREIARIIEVPVPSLLDGNNIYNETMMADGATLRECSYHYQGDVIWGATARILTQFLGIFGPMVDGNASDGK